MIKTRCGRFSLPVLPETEVFKLPIFSEVGQAANEGIKPLRFSLQILATRSHDDLSQGFRFVHRHQNPPLQMNRKLWHLAEPCWILAPPPSQLLSRFQFWPNWHSMGHRLSKALKIASALETSAKNKDHKPQNHICDNDAFYL